jgi:magnesium transporter
MATGNVLEHYSHADMISLTMVMWFVPLIISTGGNSGSQSATLIIRAMAVGRLEGSSALKILGRELLIGAILGGMVGAVGVGRVLIASSTRSLEMAITVGAAITCVVTVGALVGSGVPMLLRRLRLDPAVSSTPFIASVLDIAGLIVYFEIALLLLP